MTRYLDVVAVFILIINIERTFGLKPPHDVKIVGSYLQWKPSNDDTVLYSLQYNNPELKSEDEWLNVSSHIGTKLRTFQITPEFYGAVFRVRTEKGNNVSEWQYSKPVQCVNVAVCFPVINLTVKNERVSLTITHMDQSLEKEYGEHIQFSISYWKVDNRGFSKVETNFITNSKNEPFPELESEQKYCFQVEYLLYNKPYGNASKKICEKIPETPEAARRRVLLYSILTTLFVSAVCGICIFVLFKYHKKVKQLLQPIQIADHYREFLCNGLSLQACPSPSSQSLRSNDLFTLKGDGDEEQEIRSLT